MTIFPIYNESSYPTTDQNYTHKREKDNQQVPIYLLLMQHKALSEYSWHLFNKYVLVQNILIHEPFLKYFILLNSMKETVMTKNIYIIS